MDYSLIMPVLVVEGTSAPETSVQLLNNGEEVGTAEVGENGTFAIPTELIEGENILRAISTSDEYTRKSETVAVTLDTQHLN